MNNKTITRIINNDLFKDSFWALFGNALGKGLSVLAGIIVARLLGKDLYGEFGLLRNTLTIIAVFSTMGLGYSGTVFISENKDRNVDRIRNLSVLIQAITIVFSSVVAFIIFLFSNELASFLEDNSLAIPIRLLSIVIVFNAITTSQIGILAGLKEFKGTARVNILSGILNFVFTCLLTWLYGFNGALISLLISQILNCFFNSLLLSNTIGCSKIHFRFLIDEVKPILGFSFPVAMQEMTVSFAHWATAIFLLKLSNYGEIGLYSAAGQWIAIIQFLPIALRNVTLSHMSGSQREDDRRKILKRMVILIIFATLLPTLIILVFNRLIDTLYGESFVNVGLVIVIACVGASINSVFSVFASDLMARRHNWSLFAINVSRELLKFPLIYIFIKISISGAFSAFYSTIIVEVIALSICLIVRNRITFYNKKWMI